MSTIHSNMGQWNAEYIISGIPRTTTSTCSGSKTHLFTDSFGTEYLTNRVSVSNLGLSGTLYVSFVSGGFDTSNYLTIAPGDTWDSRLSLTKLYVSGPDTQPYNVTAMMTEVKSETATLPSEITGLYGWWKPEQGITLVSGYVSGWADSIGGKVLNGTSAGNIPTFVSNIPEMNNKSGLLFDGASDNLFSLESVAFWKMLTSQTGSTVAVVGYPMAAGAAIWSTAAPTTTRVGRQVIFGLTTNETVYEQKVCYSGSATALYTTASAGFKMSSSLYHISAIDSDKLYTKASGLNYITSSHGITLGDNASQLSFRIGSNNGATTFFGYINEVIVYNKTLTQPEMALLSKYFINKYNTIK